MTVFAHVGGVPVEELAATVAGSGSLLLVARAWLSLWPRDRRGASRPRS